MNIIRKGILATTLAASAFVGGVAPAVARDGYRDRGDDTAAIAIGAGVLGLAVGAIAASNNDRDRYYDRRYYRDDRYYRNDRYYDRSRGYDAGRRDRGDRYDRGYRNDGRRGYDSRYYGRRGY